VITGTLKLSADVCRGITYIEILISFLILSSGVLACGLLIARVQLTQTEATQTLGAELMADYMRTQLVLHLESSGSVEAEIFYPDHQLLEGYRAADFDIGDDNPLGCIRFDSNRGVYTIGIFFAYVRGSSSVVPDCDDHSFQAKTSYKTLPPENSGSSQR